MANSVKKAKEVGIRKTIGATRFQLMCQYIGESLLVTAIAVLFAICIVELVLPWFNQLTEKSLGFGIISNLKYSALILGFILFVGIIAGSYPAFFLSSFDPSQVLKSNLHPKGANSFIRKCLVVTQFCISIFFIIATLIIYLQMKYIKDMDLGFNGDKILVIDAPLNDTNFVKKFKEVKQEMLLNPSVLKVTGCDNYIPGNGTSQVYHKIEDENHQKSQQLTNLFSIDYDFLEALNIPIVKGRNFSKDFITDEKAAFIVNEMAVKTFGWKDPFNTNLRNALGYNGKIIGVVKDFNYSSLHDAIEPLVIVLNAKAAGNLLLKLKSENIASTMEFVKTKWKMFSKKYPMEYYFLDQKIDQQYHSEQKIYSIFMSFSVLTILISCLGLFGLSLYTAEQRTKEIGIRKIMGSTLNEIMLLIVKDFLKLVVVGVILASPIAYYMMNKWLQKFAYHIDIGFSPFLAAGLIAFIIALITVSFHTLKVAIKNPVESLRYE